MARACAQEVRKRSSRALARGMSARAAVRQIEVSGSIGVKWAQRWRAAGQKAAEPIEGCKQLLQTSAKTSTARTPGATGAGRCSPGCRTSTARG
jgi:transposase